MGEFRETSDMTPADWKKVSELFDECIDYPPGQWDTILNRRRETDESVLAEVKKLLSNREMAGIFFNSLTSRIEAEISPVHQHVYKAGNRIGKFTVNREISRGGMSVVYLAEMPGSKTDLAVTGKLPRAAIKIMSCHAGNPWKSFRQEQNILSAVSHPNIAELYDYGITREGLLYIAMEYIDGVAVERFCDMHGLGIGDRLRLVLQVCDALQYSHDKQIIHMDIKPSNLLVDRTGKVKVIDFGVAAILHDPGNHSRSATGFSGTLSYAAPEQLEGVAPSFSSDIYQIGMVMHKLITGNLPPTDFNYQSIVPAEYSCSLKNLPLPARIKLDHILEQSLAGDPARRYQTVNALKSAIQMVLDNYPYI